MSKVKVKVCGITNVQDAFRAIEYGADALGFVFAPSPRRITPEQARGICSKLPPFVTRVGVFVDEPLNKVKRIMRFCSLDLAQLHGDESPKYCQSLGRQALKVFRVKDIGVLSEIMRYKIPAFLLDSYVPGKRGGSGKSFNWKIAHKASGFGKVVLSGGLNHRNVLEAIRAARPYAVDVSSGVESSPGKKDYRKLRKFMAEVQKWNSRTE